MDNESETKKATGSGSKRNILWIACGIIAGLLVVTAIALFFILKVWLKGQLIS